MLNWIKNYLYNRRQYTVVNNVSSDVETINCGVPQGSVLGALLYLVYLNDISNVVHDSRLKLFADDTNLFIFGKNLTDVEKKANINLKCMEQWFLANKLSLNVNKTAYTIFYPRKNAINLSNINLVINNQSIEKISTCKYLGVHIDEFLK